MKGADGVMQNIVQYNDWLEEEVIQLNNSYINISYTDLEFHYYLNKYLYKLFYKYFLYKFTIISNYLQLDVVINCIHK